MPNFLMPRLNFSARSKGYWDGHKGGGVKAFNQSGISFLRVRRFVPTDLLIRLVFCLPEEADVLDEPRLDVLVIHELAEDVKLLTQELVGEIDLSCPRQKKCSMDEMVRKKGYTSWLPNIILDPNLIDHMTYITRTTFRSLVRIQIRSDHLFSNDIHESQRLNFCTSISAVII